MKYLTKIYIVLFVLFNFACATQSNLSAQQENISTQVFYDQLSPYGQWVDNPSYGYVWIPEVDQNFSPYSTSGYWVMTDYGWTWVSDYTWGWAPFHYGRWDFNNNYGWFWVPDNEWGPSWVTWRTGNGYYGWTPMRPGMGINHNYGNNYNDTDRWHFVHARDFGRRDMHRHYANRSEYNTIIVNTTVINNTYIDRSRNSTYIAGPSRHDVQRVTGRKVNTVSIRDNDRPGQQMNRNQLNIYRPQIQNTSGRDRTPVPNRITDQKDVIPVRERNSNNQHDQITPAQNNRQNNGQSQPIRQTEKRNQEQNQQLEQQRQQQQQLERQQQQKQQINKRIQESAKQRQKTNTQQQNERRQQNQNQQHQEQQRQEQQRNRDQQTKQQQEQNQQKATDPSDKKRERRQ